MQFSKGDIVQVDYKSTKLIEEWMSGLRAVGPGDVGVVKYSGVQAEFGPHKPFNKPDISELVTVIFPLLGTYGISSRDLKLLQKVEHAEGG